MKHTYFAWAVTYEGRPEWNIRLAGTERECWNLALMKFNVKRRQALVRRGIGIVRVRVTVVVDSNSAY